MRFTGQWRPPGPDRPRRDRARNSRRRFRSLEEGQIAATPIRSRFGAHVLKLDARADGEILPFEYVREQIRSYLAEQQWRRDVAAYIERLVDQAHIEGVDMSPANVAKVQAA